MNEEYEALMRFHVLMSDKDVSRLTHAAVDADGSLICYITQPITTTRSMWVNQIRKSSRFFEKGYEIICSMPPCEFWKETLIEL